MTDRRKPFCKPPHSPRNYTIYVYYHGKFFENVLRYSQYIDMMRFGHLPQRHLFSTHALMLPPSPLLSLRPTAKSRSRSHKYLTVISRRFQSRLPSDPQPSIRNISNPKPIARIEPQILGEREKNGPSRGPANDALLAGRTISNKEQRKADWTIMKEMSRYLWPKVTQTHCDSLQPFSDIAVVG